MVTAKRKINNEQERYGGFSEIEVKEPVTAPKIQVAPPMQNVQTMQPKVQSTQDLPNKSFYDAQVQAAEASVNYSQIRSKEQPSETIVEPITTQYKQTAEDVMPKIRSQRDYAPAPVTKQKLDHKTKVVLGVYLSIILLLSALVLTTGILLSSTGARVDDLENELAVKTATYNNQLGEIEVLGDDETIRNSAIAGGMENIESAKEFDLLPMGEVPTYSETTNWFDSVCDWLSGVFGG